MEIIISHCKKKTSKKHFPISLFLVKKKSLLYQNVLTILGRERSPFDAVIVNLFLFFKCELIKLLALLLNSEERKKGFAKYYNDSMSPNTTLCV